MSEREIPFKMRHDHPDLPPGWRVESNLSYVSADGEGATIYRVVDETGQPRTTCLPQWKGSPGEAVREALEDLRSGTGTVLDVGSFSFLFRQLQGRPARNGDALSILGSVMARYNEGVWERCPWSP